MISLKSAIFILRLLMLKYPITGFLGYCYLHLRKSSRSEKQEVYIWGHADGVFRSLKNY